jgi:hypothetical protein
MKGQCDNEIIQYTCIADTLIWFESYRVLLHVGSLFSFLEEDLWSLPSPNCYGYLHSPHGSFIHIAASWKRHSGTNTAESPNSIHHSSRTTRHDTRSKEWKPKEAFEKYVHSSRYHTQNGCTYGGLKLLLIINTLENRQQYQVSTQRYILMMMIMMIMITMMKKKKFCLTVNEV